jgi:hypothetical protein
MLMLDHHINDGALAPRQGHEQCEGGPSPTNATSIEDNF